MNERQLQIQMVDNELLLVEVEKKNLEEFIKEQIQKVIEIVLKFQ